MKPERSAMHQRSSQIALIATDIDGTLLDAESQLPPANRRALMLALDRGVRLALVTARKQASTFAIAQALDLPCACVSHNGARIWDWDGAELLHLVLDMAVAQRIAELADAQYLPLIMTINEVNYYNPAYPFDERWRSPLDLPVDSSLAVLVAPPTRMIVAGQEAIRQLQHALQPWNEQLMLHRYYNRDNTLESALINHPQATKEGAVALLADSLGISSAQVLALGDAQADAGMLAWAGIGVAMGNAMPEARAVADWIAPSHDQAGLAVGVDRFVLNT